VALRISCVSYNTWQQQQQQQQQKQQKQETMRRLMVRPPHQQGVRN
jgi:hypothetical protein